MTNLLLTITLLTNPVPVEVIPISNGRIDKLSIVERYVTSITNGESVVHLTNDVLKGYALRQYMRTWVEVPLSNPDPKSPLPFSPGSVRQP